MYLWYTAMWRIFFSNSLDTRNETREEESTLSRKTENEQKKPSETRTGVKKLTTEVSENNNKFYTGYHIARYLSLFSCLHFLPFVPSFFPSSLVLCLWDKLRENYFSCDQFTTLCVTPLPVLMLDARAYKQFLKWE